MILAGATELVGVNELVNNTEMAERGFTHTEVVSRGNTTVYFKKEGSNYVYVETYASKLGMCARLIVDKSIFDRHDLEHKTVILNTGKGDGKRIVPSISADKTIKALHKCFFKDAQVDHSYVSLNIITNDSLRKCTTADNARNKKNLHKCKQVDGVFQIDIKEKKDFFTEADMDTLRNEGYTVSKLANGVHIRKTFETELEGLKAARDYEERFYGDFAYNPLKDMRGHFNLKFKQLILEEMTEEDVTRAILKSISSNAVLIARYNLEEEYEKRGISYNHGRVLQDGHFVA